MADTLLEVKGLTRRFGRAPGLFGGAGITVAVDAVSFTIPRGRSFALVGESGSGKSTVARVVAGLLAPSEGEIRYNGALLADPRTRRRAPIQMVFQDPYSSLNPQWRVGAAIAEALRYGGGQGDVAGMLRLVALDPRDGEKYPHQFSGGQRQRIAIARAIAAQPELLICDEPTSALDVSVQAQIINLLLDLQAKQGLTCLFISHNLAVVRQVADEIGVMFKGRLVETGSAAAIIDQPQHDYTRTLIAATPAL